MTNKYRVTRNRDWLFFVPKDRNDTGHNNKLMARYSISEDRRGLSKILDIIKEYGVDISAVKEK